MAHVGFHHRLAARISALTDFAVKLGRVALTLAPSLEQVVFIRIKLTRTQGTRSRQRGVWWLSEILAHCITSQTQFFSNLAQAHPGCMQFLYPLIQFPFAQETCLRLPLTGRGCRKR